MVKKIQKEPVNPTIKESLTEIVDGKLYKQYTEEDEIRFRTYEGANWCNATKNGTKAGIPLFIVKERCKYISNMIGCVNPESSKICLQATKAKDWNKFSNLCAQATTVWNTRMAELDRKKDSELGIV